MSYIRQQIAFKEMFCLLYQDRPSVPTACTKAIFHSNAFRFLPLPSHLKYSNLDVYRLCINLNYDIWIYSLKVQHSNGLKIKAEAKATPPGARTFSAVVKHQEGGTVGVWNSSLRFWSSHIAAILTPPSL